MGVMWDAMDDEQFVEWSPRCFFVLDHAAHGKRLSAWPLHRRMNLNRRQSYAAKTQDVLELSNYVIRGGIS